VIPIDEVCREYFSHLETEKLLAKITRGEIALPVISAERSRKSAKGVYIQDLANYIDEQREAAVKARDQLCGLR
jgi:hypothetical protein